MWLYLQWRRLFNDWVALSAIARDAARNLGDRNGEAAALTSLGLALGQVGRFEEAIAACTDAAQSCRDVGDRDNEASALTNLGLAQANVGRLRKPSLPAPRLPDARRTGR